MLLAYWQIEDTRFAEHQAANSPAIGCNKRNKQRVCRPIFSRLAILNEIPNILPCAYKQNIRFDMLIRFTVTVV